MSEYRILVTGSRTFDNRDWLNDALWSEIIPLAHTYKDYTVTVVHGGARGADALASKYVEGEFRRWDEYYGLTLVEEVHRADWDTHGKAAGFIRNQEMVDAGADICLAFRSPGKSNGTDDCIKRAHKAGIPVVIHLEPAAGQPQAGPKERSE